MQVSTAGCRLWKEHGQSRLESTNVCLLNATATGTEIIKNLVLPGIRSFTIVDSLKVNAEDVGDNNFFICPDCVGQSRAVCVTNALRDMNEDVLGFHVEDSPANIIVNNSDFFEKFQLVVACDLEDEHLLQLSVIMHKLKMPLVVCLSYGLIGYLRLVLPDTLLYETHAENYFDLRLNCPWKELKAFVDALKFESMDSLEKSHVPYIAILIKAYEASQRQNVEEGERRKRVKEIIRELLKDIESDENMEEALSQSYRLFQTSKVPSSLIETCNLSNETTLPYADVLLLKSLKEFIAANNSLPLPGLIPDMKADTTSFVALQKIYREKGLEDIKVFRKIVDEHAAESTMHTNEGSVSPTGTLITDEEVERFCKNAAHIKVIKYRSIGDEADKPNIARLQEFIEMEERCCMWYIALVACRKFRSLYKRYPGQHNNGDGDDYEKDIAPLKKLNQLIAIPDEYFHEICRFGGSEVHNISAFMGGIGAQECIKVITGQYVPLNNTLLFDGIESKCWAFEA